MRREYDIAAKEKTEMEQAHFNAVAKLKSQMDEKIKEVESLKHQVLTPKYLCNCFTFENRDMEISRLKNLKDFEGSVKKKWRVMDDEIQKYRTNYYALKKEHEELISNTSRLVN